MQITPWSCSRPISSPAAAENNPHSLTIQLPPDAISLPVFLLPDLGPECGEQMQQPNGLQPPRGPPEAWRWPAVCRAGGGRAVETRPAPPPGERGRPGATSRREDFPSATSPRAQQVNVLKTRRARIMSSNTLQRASPDLKRNPRGRTQFLNLKLWIIPNSLSLYLSLSFFFFFFAFFRTAPEAWGGSQARRQIRAAAAGLHHSQSHAGSLTH